MKLASYPVRRTGPTAPATCGCAVLPWERCIHSDTDARPAAPVYSAPTQALAVARAFHEAYERLAPLNGYETRKDTRHFDPDTANGRTMLAVVSELLRTDVIRARQV